MSATPVKPNFSFPKSARLLKRGEFRRVYDQGSRVTSPSFAMFFARRDGEPATGARIGFTTPRAVGNSVLRNCLKRRMREALRLTLPAFHQPVDYVFHPRRPVADLAFPQLCAEVARVLRRAEAAAR